MLFNMQAQLKSQSSVWGNDSLEVPRHFAMLRVICNTHLHYPEGILTKTNTVVSQLFVRRIQQTTLGLEARGHNNTTKAHKKCSVFIRPNIGAQKHRMVVFYKENSHKKPRMVVKPQAVSITKVWKESSWSPGKACGESRINRLRHPKKNRIIHDNSRI